MYRLREMDVDDKVCEQVDMSLLARVYSSEAIQRCVGRSQPWMSKARGVRQSTLLALVLFVIGMALWSRLSQRLVWDKLVGKLSALHPAEPQSELSASALSGYHLGRLSGTCPAARRARAGRLGSRGMGALGPAAPPL
jgi:Insertion element 4 transposase N-terminal